MVDVVDVRRDTPAPEPSRAAVPSAWAPLRHTWFRGLWIAQFVANTGTWAQTVGAQWLMGDLGGSALQIALVQTAATLPVFLLVIPAGALGDILDRRRLLLLSQTLMLLASAALAVLTAAGGVTPNRLLASPPSWRSGRRSPRPASRRSSPNWFPGRSFRSRRCSTAPTPTSPAPSGPPSAGCWSQRPVPPPRSR